MTVPPEPMKAIMSRVQSIRPLPAAVERLCRLTKDLESDSDEIVRIISMDETLATRMLRVANSAFYGFSQGVKTISQAVLLLGFQGVRSLALSVSVLDMRMGMDLKGLKRVDLWRHSLAVATASRDMAEYLHVSEMEEAFLGGLLHDIGKIVIMEVFPEKYEEVLTEARNRMVPLFELEKKEFGIDHAEVGAALGAHWKIPHLFCEIVSTHYAIDGELQKTDKITFLVQVADGLAKMAQVGSDGDEVIPVHLFDALSPNDFPPEYIRRLVYGLPEQISKAEIFFNLPTHEPNTIKKNDPAGMLVLLKKGGEKEIAQMALLSLGFNLLTLREAQREEENFAGVITDAPLPQSIQEICTRRGLPVLDFPEWKSRSHPESGGALIHVSHFKEWLMAQMTSEETDQNE